MPGERSTARRVQSLHQGRGVGLTPAYRGLNHRSWWTSEVVAAPRRPVMSGVFRAGSPHGASNLAFASADLPGAVCRALSHDSALARDLGRILESQEMPDLVSQTVHLVARDPDPLLGPEPDLRGM